MYYLSINTPTEMGQLRLKTRFNTQFIERFLADSELYQSLEELKEAENDPNECGRINWEAWDRAVQECKQQLSQHFNYNDSPAIERRLKPIWVYDLKGKPKGHFSSARETAERMNLNKGTISQMAWKKIPYWKASLFFSYEELTKDEVKAIVAERQSIRVANDSRQKEKWVYDLRGKLLGHFSSSEEVAIRFDIDRGAVNYYSWKGEPYKLKGLMIRNQPIDK